MAHTTSIYYRDRLGFEPESDPSQNRQTHPYHAQYSAAAESHSAPSHSSSSHPRSSASSTKTRKTRTMKTHRESTMSSSATSTVVRESHYSGTTASASNMGGTTSSSHHVTSSSSRVMSSNGNGHVDGGQQSYSIRDYSDSYRDRDLRERDVTHQRYLEENSASTLTGGVYEENLTKFKGKTVSHFADCRAERMRRNAFSAVFLGVVLRSLLKKRKILA